ncbi:MULTISPECIES: FAD-dependent oxidoreductase [Rhodomicrobium]|uniref:FAD-dependent oxidoreductase n=1 Tax=Rhodomicrobium vannielii TaxID=1069 RepID=UPI000B4ABC5C|nr:MULTISPECIES: FAD-dependent oxidoreductase [Rhodomicrobium]
MVAAREQPKGAKLADILIAGAGITGLWQTLTLARAGHRVRLVERSAEPFADAASRLAGAMLAPYCESESAEPLIAELGLQALPLWRALYPETRQQGSLILAAPRDLPELARFARMTSHFERLDGAGVAALEPAFAGRYGQALFYPSEAHVEPGRAMPALLRLAQEAGARVEFGARWDEAEPGSYDHVIDCRGIAASPDLPELRGVRGEMLVVETDEIALRRPVRLLHPRFPLYVVPWAENRFMIGATVIESGDRGPATVRSALDLLGLAYTLHPAFGEARILRFAADVRPSFPDNMPRITLRGRRILVNGLYRHGFLLAPSLAALVAHYIKDGTTRQDVFLEDYCER